MIGLVAVDSHHYPNYALMKLAAYHRSLGDAVEWADPIFGEYDRVYMSKVFSFTPDCPDTYRCEIVRGGTGYDLHSKLPPEVEYIQPDYSLYPDIDRRMAYGFITRGCPNKCPWCVVPRKEGNVTPYMDIDDITQGGRRPNVILMDNNILAHPYGLEQLAKVAEKGYRIDLNQANDARRITEEIAEILARVRWINGVMRLAADTTAQIAAVERAMRLIDSRRDTPLQYLVYAMINNDLHESYERLTYFRTNKRVRVAAQPFRDVDNPSQVIPQWQKDMARWAMRRELWTTCDFKDFSPRKGFVCKEYFSKN